MTSRIAHISDLHFPARNEGQVIALSASIAAVNPDLIVVTGDLTRAGTHDEFQQAKEFLKCLKVPALVVPGNHDIPVPGLWARLRNPFARFNHYFGGSTDYLETPDFLVVGLNTAVGWQTGWDWSLGYVIPNRVDEASRILQAHRHGRLGLVACHHPLHVHPLDPVRSRTFGSDHAFDQLSASGMNILLHGHLHRSDRRQFRGTSEQKVYEICANTALSNRERGGPAGYNVIDAHERWWRLTKVSWHNGQYQTAAGEEAWI